MQIIDRLLAISGELQGPLGSMADFSATAVVPTEEKQSAKAACGALGRAVEKRQQGAVSVWAQENKKEPRKV